jgi:hypothetical protein
MILHSTVFGLIKSRRKSFCEVVSLVMKTKWLSVILCTTNVIWTGPESNPGFRGWRPAIKRPSPTMP